MNPDRLVRLYPRSWQRRYGPEFEALLEDRPPTAVQALDIVMGALDARISPQVVGSGPQKDGRYRMFARLAGLSAASAGVVLAAGFIVNIDPDWNPYRVLAFYLLGLPGLVAIHLRQVAVRPGLAWLAFGAALVAAVYSALAVLIGILGVHVLGIGIGQIAILGGIAFWLSGALLGATILAIGVFSAAPALAITLGAPLAMIGMFIGGSAGLTVQAALAEAGVLLYALGWIWLGASLVARTRSGEVLAD